MHILTLVGNELLLEKDSLDISRRMWILHFICHLDLIKNQIQIYISPVKRVSGFW